MNNTEFVSCFWRDMDAQKWGNLQSYFKPDAVIDWPNTKERFTVDEFVNVNAEYPGDWNITVKRMEQTENRVVSVAFVQLAGGSQAFTAVSFFEFENERISALTEYWGDVGEPPAWRKNKA